MKLAAQSNEDSRVSVGGVDFMNNSPQRSRSRKVAPESSDGGEGSSRRMTRLAPNLGEEDFFSEDMQQQQQQSWGRDLISGPPGTYQQQVRTQDAVQMMLSPGRGAPGFAYEPQRDMGGVNPRSMHGKTRPTLSKRHMATTITMERSLGRSSWTGRRGGETSRSSGC